MKKYPEHIKFKYSWRKYQQRVLEQLDKHLEDKHLHIVAPPGSGKTVLGLEVAIRVNQPTLILAPTISIQNQWIHRFCELFLQTHTVPDWISTDIRNPEFMTVVTYQGVHAACRGSNNNENSSHKTLESIVKKLKAKNIKTIILDEAHHLKNEWWQTLSKIKELLSPTIIGLTATPPYDVTSKEWKRYIDLNGAIDTEISIPELIIEGDLCPHQDYVYYSLPSEEEYKQIVKFRQRIKKLFQELKHSKDLLYEFENQPIWKNPAKHLDWIYENTAYYSTGLIFLNTNQRTISHEHTEIIGNSRFEIPTLTDEWMEILLNLYLNNEKIEFKNTDYQNYLRNKLKRYGVIERNQVKLTHHSRLDHILSSSISKLNSINNIVEFEYKQLGSDLRMVILSDFIRKEFFINETENNLPLHKLGVMPIFEMLRRNNNGKKIGVLTGSIIIIPTDAYPKLVEKASKYGIDSINSIAVPYDENYISIIPSESIKNNIVHLVTNIFQNGEIEILVGTKSLLGEGWDAPAINALILSSFVGSFVLSNQMRGRAIRTQKNNHNKTANIWHLACVDPTSEYGGEDIETLNRRFKSFVGISLQNDISIENNLQRLNPPKLPCSNQSLQNKNTKTFVYASDRAQLKTNWQNAINNGNTLVEEIKIPFSDKKSYKKSKFLYFNKTIANLITTLLFSILGFFIEGIFNLKQEIINIKSIKDFYHILVILSIVGAALFGRQTLKTLKLYIKYRDITKDIHNIGNALLYSLIKEGSIKTDNSLLKVQTSIDNQGNIFCHLDGGNSFEKSLFINTLKEIIEPVDNPRYIIIRKSNFLSFIKQNDYHSVPELLGRNKSLAEYFQNQWKSNVGTCELIFTRNPEGRKLILKSRMKSLASKLSSKTELISKWK
ncbi:DEAD/DEAH box helicase family protein [Riemerella anatipestifer]|nr:DEAD/DEAH box helicase family protein [Riemerella anatipestifer]